MEYYDKITNLDINGSSLYFKKNSLMQDSRYVIMNSKNLNSDKGELTYHIKQMLNNTKANFIYDKSHLHSQKRSSSMKNLLINNGVSSFYQSKYYNNDNNKINSNNKKHVSNNSNSGDCNNNYIKIKEQNKKVFVNKKPNTSKIKAYISFSHSNVL